MRSNILHLYPLWLPIVILLSGCGKNSNDYYQSGVEHLRNHKTEEALSDFDNAIRLDSNNARAYLDRAIIKANSAVTKPDESDISQYISLSAPNLAFAYVARAWTRETRQQYDFALQDLNKAIAIDSDYIYGYVFKERVLREKGDTLQLQNFLQTIGEKTRRRMAENTMLTGFPVEIPNDVANPTATDTPNNNTSIK